MGPFAVVWLTVSCVSGPRLVDLWHYWEGGGSSWGGFSGWGGGWECLVAFRWGLLYFSGSLYLWPELARICLAGICLAGIGQSLFGYC